MDKNLEIYNLLNKQFHQPPKQIKNNTVLPISICPHIQLTKVGFLEPACEFPQ